MSHDLDESILKMTRDELLEEVADRIQCMRELMMLHRKEERFLKQDIKMLEDALRSGTKTLEMTTLKMKDYDRIMTNATRTIYMWKYSCYALVVLLIVISFVLA